MKTNSNMKEPQEHVPSAVGGIIPKTSEAVDLGLPSGTLWAPWNVGANAPGENGAYFAFGETTNKDEYSEDTYKWRNEKYKWWKKKNYNRAKTKSFLDPEDDAAIVNWGGKWRMPTVEECAEIDNCTWSWKEANEFATGSLAGCLVTGPNGNSIFLPATGFMAHDSVYLYGFCCKYWQNHERFLFGKNRGPALIPGIVGCFGLPVRAVCSAAE